MSHSSQQSGIVLILALLIITAALVASAALGNLIIRGIQQSRLVDQSMQAHYLAESGAERALHQVRQRTALHDCALIGAGSCSALGYCDGAGFETVPCITAAADGLGAAMPSDWSVAAVTERSVVKRLEPGESFQIDLFNPYQDIGGLGLEAVEAIQMVSAVTPAFTLYGQLTNLNWLLGGTLPCPAGAPIIANGFITGTGNVAAISGLAGTDLNPACLYIFRISKPIKPSGPDTFTITLHSASPPTEGNRIDIPSRLVIDAAADFGQSFQTVKVRTPVRPPLSGLYDFVLFSDTEIIK